MARPGRRPAANGEPHRVARPYSGQGPAHAGAEVDVGCSAVHYLAIERFAIEIEPPISARARRKCFQANPVSVARDDGVSLDQDSLEHRGRDMKAGTNDVRKAEQQFRRPLRVQQTPFKEPLRAVVQRRYEGKSARLRDGGCW